MADGSVLSCLAPGTLLHQDSYIFGFVKRLAQLGGAVPTNAVVEGPRPIGSVLTTLQVPRSATVSHESTHLW
eukprot:10463060-Alexandrium_andersonii.AAC.1